MNWGNRKPIISILAIAFGITSIVFLLAAAWYNPSIQGLFVQKPIVRSIVGMARQFNLPPQISFSEPATAYFGSVFCNVTSDAFDVGNPILVSVEVNLPTAMENKLYFIEVKVTNAIMYIPFSGQNDVPYPSDIVIFPTNNSGVGSQIIVVETSGMLGLTATIYFEYPLGSPNLEVHYDIDLTFPNIQIGTGEEARQQITENMNLSLTFFVLFFACVDIAVVFYDHSEKNPQKPNTEDAGKKSQNEGQSHLGNFE